MTVPMLILLVAIAGIVVTAVRAKPAPVRVRSNPTREELLVAYLEQRNR